MARRDEGAYPQRSVSEEQRSQTAFCPWPALALSLQPAAEMLGARAESTSPPWPRPKSLAAGPLPILKQALKRDLSVEPRTIFPQAPSGAASSDSDGVCIP